MTQPSSLCWEGVSLGWREVVPQTRSRGGEVRTSHTPTDSTVHSAKLDSGLNSLDYWDYSVELECLSGPEGRGAGSTASSGSTWTTVLSWSVSLDLKVHIGSE